MKQKNPTFLKHTLEKWQPHYVGPLTEEDAGAITTNMTNFFDILLEWDRQPKKMEEDGKSGKGGTSIYE